jgi:hypothetical protein
MNFAGKSAGTLFADNFPLFADFPLKIVFLKLSV